MSDDPSLSKLRARVEAANAERDAALASLERQQAEALDQRRLLEEEQDRFVSRLLVSHEREMRRVRAELDELKGQTRDLEEKIARESGASSRLREEREEARARIAQLGEQRDTARAELRRAVDGKLAAETIVDLLRGDLALARSMLEDAMALGDDTTTAAAEPTRYSGVSPSAAYVPPTSGIRNPPRARYSAPPAVRERDGRRSETPRAVSGTSRDSRPPR